MRSVRYISIAENSGYGNAAQAYMRALRRAGVALEWFPLLATPEGYAPWYTLDGEKAANWLAGLGEGASPDGFYGSQIQGAISRDMDHDTLVLHCVPEYWPLYLEPGKQNVGYTVWETDRLPPHWAELLNATDRVLVPCQFNVAVFRESGVNRPIDVVPHIKPPRGPVASPQTQARLAEKYGIPRDHFIFYGTDVWSPRKAPWKTLHAFLQAFTADDRVSFVLKTSAVGPRSSAEVENVPTDLLVREVVSHYEKPANIVLINENLQGDDIDALHQLGDCYLSLTHCEGWGLGAFQAAALGKPVIITGWSGHLDYLTSEWPYLIEFEMTPVMHAQGRSSYLPTQNWASPSLEHAVQLITEVYQNPKSARTAGEKLAKRIDVEFNERVVGRQLLDALGRTA